MRPVAVPPRPVGTGPDAWLPAPEGAGLPPGPMLLLGAPGSGRATWATYVLARHGREARVRPLTMATAREAIAASGIARRAAPVDVLRIEAGARGAAAADALLKTLEEPPRGWTCLLTSTPSGAPATVRSRCETATLAPADLDDQVAAVARAADVDEETAELLVALAPNRPGAAVAMLPALPARRAARAVLAAAEARDRTALHAALSDTEAVGAERWVGQWVDSAISGRATEHLRMASECTSARLTTAREALRASAIDHRLGLWRAATVLTARPG